jgi:hypothetical protein
MTRLVMLDFKSVDRLLKLPYCETIVVRSNGVFYAIYSKI